MTRTLRKNQNPFTSNYAVYFPSWFPSNRIFRDYLRYYLRELNETNDIDRGQFESVNFYLSLLLVEFMCLVFICLLQNQNNYD